MNRPRKPQKKSWIDKADIEDFAARRAAAPEELRSLFLRFANDMSDLGEKHKVPPKTMAALASGIIGLLALAEVDGQVHDDASIDDFIAFCHRAMHMAVAGARINSGWRPLQ